MPTNPDINYPLIKAEQIKDSDYLRIIRQTGLNEAEGFKLRIGELLKIAGGGTSSREFRYFTNDRFISWPNNIVRVPSADDECDLDDPTETELQEWIEFHSSDEVQELWAQALADEWCGSDGTTDKLFTAADQLMDIFIDLRDEYLFVAAQMYNEFQIQEQKLQNTIYGINYIGEDSTLVTEFLTNCENEVQFYMELMQARSNSAQIAHVILYDIIYKGQQKASDCGWVWPA